MNEKKAEELVCAFIAESGSKVTSIDEVKLVDEEKGEYSVTATINGNAIRHYGVDSQEVVWSK